MTGNSTWVTEETALWASDSVMGPLVGQLAHHPVTHRDLESSLESLGELASLRAWLDAQEAKLLTRVTELVVGGLAQQGYGGPVAEEYGESLAAAEVGATLRMPDRTATQLIKQAQLLVDHFPATVEALQLGRISRRHAIVVAQECCDVPQQEVPEFEEQLLDIARGTTAAKLGHRARRLREELHPESLTVRRKKKVLERSVSVEPCRDGMAWLSAYLPAEQAYGIANRLDVTARSLQGPGEHRTLGQLRADVFSDLLTHACVSDPTVNRTHEDDSSASSGSPLQVASEPAAAGYRGVTARVMVTVPVLTLLGGIEPAELDGYGPIDAGTARKLAGHAPSFTRLLTHPETGAVLSVGRTRYKPPKDLQDWVRIRDRTCRHPGCNRTAMNCEIDHTTPWSQGGETRANNLAALCKKHHMFKTLGFWKHRQPEDGTLHVTSVAGRRYTTTPGMVPSHSQSPPF